MPLFCQHWFDLRTWTVFAIDSLQLIGLSNTTQSPSLGQDSNNNWTNCPSAFAVRTKRLSKGFYAWFPFAFGKKKFRLHSIISSNMAFKPRRLCYHQTKFQEINANSIGYYAKIEMDMNYYNYHGAILIPDHSFLFWFALYLHKREKLSPIKTTLRR